MSSDELEKTREEVISTFEQSAEAYGLNRSAGRVYGVLFFSNEPLSIPELVDKTGYAKSTISNVTRKLTRIGLIHRRSSDGGGRRVHFVPETDFWRVINDVFQQYVHREMKITQRTLTQSLDTLEEMDEQAPVVQDRLRNLTATYRDLHRLLELSIEHSPDELIEAIEAYNQDSK